MSFKLPLFEVPIVSANLEQEEMLVQIADSLEYLAKVVEIVFSSIESGVKRQQAKLSDIDNRTEAARLKIEKLTGSKSATKVFSSAKYPATHVNKNYLSLFSNVVPLPCTTTTNSWGKKRFWERRSNNEKLQFYHVKTKLKLLKRNINIAPQEGLGELPFNFTSVASLLLFNTAESPYKRYVSLDPMGVVNKQRHLVNEEEVKTMDAAPVSIALGEQLPVNMQESYLYLPSLGEVPFIDVPIDLPDLPGIVDDLRFDLDAGPGLAPSNASTPATPAIPELPTIVPDEPKITLLPKEVPPPPPPPVFIPPPPPPPHARAELPAPPPPPPPVINPQPSKSDSEGKPSPKAIPVSDDARANLMEAIRSAGGKAKLRNVREGQDEIRRKKEEKAIASGGDLMADLHNRLLMRRKGISGAKSSITAMDKVSAMIPPPPTQHDTSSATEDDDWD